MAEEQMRRAQQLIREKRYGEARALLVGVNHPKAKEWIARIDQIQMQQSAPTTRMQRPDAMPTPRAQAPVRQRPAAAARAEAPAGKPTTFLSVIGAIVGGLIFAILGAVLWALILRFAEQQNTSLHPSLHPNVVKGLPYLGVIAMALLIALGTMLFSGGRRGKVSAFFAVLMAALGVAITNLALLTGASLSAFFQSLPAMLRVPSQILSHQHIPFVLIAMFAAWAFVGAARTRRS